MSPPPRRRPSRGGDDATHAAALSGGGPSQLGISGSMRARDVSRPSAQDVADAERLVQVSYRPQQARSTTGGAGYEAGSGGSSPVSS